MSRAPTKPVQMAFLTIGYVHVLMPSDKAMKVAELMQHAVPAERDWAGTGEVYVVKEEALNVGFKLARSNQIRMPHGESMPTPAPRQRLLK